MDRRRFLPDTNRLSVLTATVLLGYILTQFVTIPAWQLAFAFLGVKITFSVDFNTLVSVMVALLAAVGAVWLLGDHPALEGTRLDWRISIQHWILPALTAWVISVPLRYLTGGLGWWVVFALGSILLILVFMAEYSVVDPTQEYQPAAVLGLTALSFSLYLLLAIAISSAGLRLYLMLPALMPAAGLVCLRTLYLRSRGQWLLIWSAVIALVVGQIAVGLHYLPLTPVSFGLLLLGPTYALTSLAARSSEGRPWGEVIGEPVIMLVLVWGMAYWLR
jgi:hypothetical protein